MSQTMYTVKEKLRPLKNNDPLAHVYLLQESYDGQLAEHRMYTEFVTDMGERLENQPFRSTYTYTYNEDEIIYDTGLQYLASLKQSYNAALVDVASGSFNVYHAERQKAFYEQGGQLLEWLHNSNSSQHALLLSLCPDEEELSYTEAKKQSFKPDRMMASIQLHSKNTNGTATTTAFSLDRLTLPRLEVLLCELGLADSVADTSKDQLQVLNHIYSDETAQHIVDVIISSYDSQLQKETQGIYKQGVSLEKTIVEANAFVTAHPEAFKLYKTIIQQAADSLDKQYVLSDLATTVSMQLAKQYRHSTDAPGYLQLQIGDTFTPAVASQLIEYLRRRAIPEYLTQKLVAPSVSNYINSDIGTAGVTASQAGRVYDGACPSSNDVSLIMSAQDLASQLNIKIAVTYETPRPILSKGDFDVIPIGSCPICGSECGVGIKNRKNGRWYCTESGCSAFKKEIYDYVYAISDLQNNNTISNAEYVQKKPANSNAVPIDVGFELRQTQNQIWILKSDIYSEETESVIRQESIKQLIAASQKQDQLIRLAMGSITIADITQYYV